jgi:hypothetical protein
LLIKDISKVIGQRQSLQRSSMGIKSLDTGRRGYLTRKNGRDLYVKIGSNVEDEILSVAYDIRVEGVTILPQGALVIGDWVSNQDDPSQIRFMTKEIFLEGQYQEFIADSDIFDQVIRFDTDKLANKNHFYSRSSTIGRRQDSTSNQGRNFRIVNKCRHMSIRQSNSGAEYVRIPAQEIPFTVVESFVCFRSGKYTTMDKVKKQCEDHNCDRDHDRDYNNFQNNFQN